MRMARTRTRTRSTHGRWGRLVIVSSFVAWSRSRGIGVIALFITRFVLPVWVVMTEEVGEDGEGQDQPEHEYSPSLVSSAHFP